MPVLGALVVLTSPVVAAAAPADPVPSTAPAPGAPAAPTAPAPGIDAPASVSGGPRVIAPSFPDRGPGAAGAPIDTVATGATATTLPCHTGGPVAADVSLATAIRPWLTGSLAAQSAPALAESISCARLVVATIAARRMDRQAAVIALATTVVESGLHNVAYGDRDSLGLFQQRPSTGWGTAAQVQDPVYATNAFAAAMVRKYPGDGWQRQQVGVVAQGVQISAFPSRYEPQGADAVQLVSRLWQEGSELVTLGTGGVVQRSAPGRCTTSNCSTGTARLDANARTVAIASGFGTYELHGGTGQLWRSTGAACNTSGCGGWTRIGIDTRTTSVVTGLGGVYQFQASTGVLSQFTGSPCVSTCTGWRVIDRNPNTTQVVATAAGVFQFQARTGQLWRFTGQPCGTSGCSGWVPVSTRAPGSTISAGAGGLTVYEPGWGRLWRAANPDCVTADCVSWVHILSDARTTDVVSGAAGLFAFQAATGALRRYNGSPCTSAGCLGWVLVDNNPRTQRVVTAGTTVLQLQPSTGQIWNWNGAVCAAACGGWVLVTVRTGTTAIAVT